MFIGQPGGWALPWALLWPRDHHSRLRHVITLAKLTVKHEDFARGDESPKKTTFT
jgi:hypothetical protein